MATIPASAFAPRVFAAVRQNVIVYKEPGRFGGWPANHGIWSWGNEIVVGFTVGSYMRSTTYHAVDPHQPFENWQARSRDGGETWVVEKPNTIVPPAAGGPRVQKLDHAMPFGEPGFALMFRFNSKDVGPSRFYYSTDRCRSWTGPFAYEPEGVRQVAARTDYVVESERACLMFATSSKMNDKEGRVFCARTQDGGLTWKRVAWIGPEPDGYMIMPSTVRVGEGSYVCTIRHKDPGKAGCIDCYRSDDHGQSWRNLGAAVKEIGAGNPPSLLKLADGRLCLVYGYRAEPFGVRAKLSVDEGASWGDEIVLREDAPTYDLGYTKSVVRPDGAIVSVYYYNGPAHSDRAIEATIWTPS